MAATSASTLDVELAKKSFNNWLKGALAVLFAREGLTEFVQNEISDFQRDLLNSIFAKNITPLGTTCNFCTTANMLKCPTPEVCRRKRPCKLHDPKVRTKSPNQKCPKNICNIVKDGIIDHHRFRAPNWEITDATRWGSDAFEIAKCYLPPKGYCNKTSLAEIDFNGTLGIIINNTRFQNKLNAQLNAAPSIYSKESPHSLNTAYPHSEKEEIQIRRHKQRKREPSGIPPWNGQWQNKLPARDVINENIRHSASYELSDVQLAQCCDVLRDILQDTMLLLHDRNAQNAVNKINQLQNETLTISAGDITKVLEENFRENITNQQQDALQAVQKYFESAHTASVADLESIKSEALDEIRKTADDKKQELLQLSQQLHITHNQDTHLNDLQEDLITYYRENESFITAAPLVEEHKVPLEDLYVRPPLRAYKNPYYFRPGNINQNPQQAPDNAQQEKEITVSGIFLSSKNTRYRKIYVTADAGFGKTSLSQKLTLTWCQAHQPLEALDEKYEDSDLDAMKYFDFLFLLHLRDYQSDPQCNLDDLIMQLVSENLSRNTLYTKEILQRLLHEKKCLIIVDGLDEWAHPEKCKKKPAIPHNNHPNSCTVLTTSRSWKLGTVGLSQNNIDRHVKISELNEKTRNELERNASQIVNAKGLNLARQSIFTFQREVALVPKDILSIPYILLQLIVLFFSGLPMGKSKCEIYSNIIELTLERGLNKADLPHIPLGTSDDAALPNCMKKNKRCKCYINLLMKLGKLAFYSLFSVSRDSSLIFDSETVELFMTKNEIEFCLKVGLLLQTKDNRIIAVKRFEVYFQHKSVQEFFSSIYITSEWNDETVKSTILKKCSSISVTLEMSNLFGFVCGENPEVYACISGELQKVVERDACRYRNDIEYDEDVETTLFSYQSMQIRFFEESVRNGNEIRSICLQDVLYKCENGKHYLNNLKQLINFNKGNIKSLRIDSSDDDLADIPSYVSNLIAEYLQSLDVGVFNNVETLVVVCEGANPWLADLLAKTASSIKCLRLSGQENYEIYCPRLSLSENFTFTEIACLQSMSLDRLSMFPITIERLYAYISKTATLRQIELVDIELEGIHLFRPLEIDDSLDLHCLNQLQILYLKEIPCKELRLNPSCLEKLEFFPLWRQTATANASLWEDLRGARVLSLLMLRKKESCQEMVQTIPTLTQLQYFALEDIDMDERKLRFSPAMTKLENVELNKLIMTPEAWRELFYSLSELPRLKFLTLCKVSMDDSIAQRFALAMTKLECLELRQAILTPEAWSKLFPSANDKLKFLKLNSMDTNDLKPCFLEAMTNLETLELYYVTMSLAALKELFHGVSGLPRFLTVELDKCEGPTYEEWKTFFREIKSVNRLTIVEDLLVVWRDNYICEEVHFIFTGDEVEDKGKRYDVDRVKYKLLHASMILTNQTKQSFQNKREYNV